MENLRNWPQVLEAVIDAADTGGLSLKFCDIKGDNAKRVKFCLENSVIRDYLTYWIKYCTEEGISLTESQAQADDVRLREEGNKLFAKREYVKSLVVYSRSIKTARDDKNRSLALANRSAALFHLKMLKDCIEDIERALEIGYPENLKPKILVRKANCLRELGETEKFNQILQQMQHAKDEKLQQEAVELGKLNITPLNVNKEDEQDLRELELLDGANVEVPSMSAALRVAKTKTRGRYVVTEKDVSAGDSLFVERPYAAVVFPDFQQTRCQSCIGRITHRHVCLDCGEASFCSSSCRDAASNTFHKYECGKQNLLNSFWFAHLGLRVLLTAGIDNLLDKKDISLMDPDYLRVYDLVTHAEDMKPSKLFIYTLAAALLTELLDLQRAHHSEDFPDDSKYWIGGLLLRHITQLVCNAHTITDISSSTDKSETERARLEHVAPAIYPSASMMNHSCDPTVINSFRGNLLIARAIKDVPASGEIFGCYGPHFRRMSRKERISALQSQYNFTCDCWHCADDTVEDFDEYISSFRCPECGGPLRNPDFSAGAKSQPGQTTLCRQCKKPQNFLPQMAADREAVELENLGAEAMENSDLRTAISCWKRCVELRLPALYKGHPDLSGSVNHLALCYAQYGSYEECLRYLKILLKCIEEQHGRFSDKFVDGLLKIICVYQGILREDTSSSVAKKQLKIYLEEAALVYSTAYGSWSKEYQEITSKMEQIGLAQ